MFMETIKVVPHFAEKLYGKLLPRKWTDGAGSVILRVCSYSKDCHHINEVIGEIKCSTSFCNALKMDLITGKSS